MIASDKLKALGISLPAPPAPVGSYLPGIRIADLIVTSGQLPFADGKLMHPGHVGADVTVEQARSCASQAALNALAIAAELAGGIDSIGRIVRVAVFVASAPRFNDQPAVANGASDLLVNIFGDAGRHARAAVGTSELPLNSCVELELTAQVS